LVVITAIGGEDTIVSEAQIADALDELVAFLGPKFNKTLLIPPDYSRNNSRAGDFTRGLHQRHTKGILELLPAQGTHKPDSESDRTKFYGRLDGVKIRDHNWRDDVVQVGTVPSRFVREISRGKVDYDIPVEVNALLVSGGFSSIISIGQVVPHEVVGMANYSKNIFVGTGGKKGIDRSHFLGAACNMESILGRADNPVRQVFDYAQDHFFNDMPLVYVLTVIGKDDEGQNVMRGLYIGDERAVFEQAAALSAKLNIELLEKPIQRAVVYLDPEEFKSTWLGNKAIYRTRMALADNGELIVMAPGVKEFGEDPLIDRLIRKYGYYGTPATLDAVRDNVDLRTNLSAAAHLIHGSSEGRFNVIYCTDPAKMPKEAVRAVGYEWANVNDMLRRYDPTKMKDGFNDDVFYVSNPALGLWATRANFQDRK